ncbi:MAG TPA: hypothetical protein VNA22_04865 [Pyrinomonadaceae bacterium]|nr:hypothetical protein [Pyrinomonadaceae bacterium]
MPGLSGTAVEIVVAREAVSMFKAIQIKRIFWAACCSLTLACGTPSKDVLVTHVDAGRAIAADGSEGALKLVVEINGDGRLLLNRIDIGTISNTSVLIEKLGTIFEDRRKASIAGREVMIQMNGTITEEHLEVLIDALIRAKASSIQITREGYARH